MSTISERLSKLLNPKELSPVFCLGKPLKFCLVCENIRIDPDPTGLTCGRERCLAELLTLYFDHEKSLKDFFLSQISSDALEPEIKLKDLLEEIENKITDSNVTMVNIAISLGWKKNIGDRLCFLSQIENVVFGDPEGGIPTIFEIVTEIAKKLKIETEGMSLRDILDEIKNEAIQINAIIKAN